RSLVVHISSLSLHFSVFLFSCPRSHRHLHSFPTRRSSDLTFFATIAGLMLGKRLGSIAMMTYILVGIAGVPVFAQMKAGPMQLIDRKSTRLNSSHVSISYAVFCLKKKKKTMTRRQLSQYVV